MSGGLSFLWCVLRVPKRVLGTSSISKGWNCYIFFPFNDSLILRWGDWFLVTSIGNVRENVELVPLFLYPSTLDVLRHTQLVERVHHVQKEGSIFTVFLHNRGEYIDKFSQMFLAEGYHQSLSHGILRLNQPRRSEMWKLHRHIVSIEGTS